MIKRTHFKSGFNIVSDSFSILLHNPILLTYQIILLLILEVISIIASKTISYPTALLFQSQQYQTQDQLLAIHNAGGFTYVLLFLAFFLIGFISNYFATALIMHVYSLDKSEPRSIWSYLKSAKSKIHTILGWSMFQDGLWWIFSVTIFLWAYHNPYNISYPPTPSFMSEQLAHHLFTLFLFIVCFLLFSLSSVSLFWASLLHFFAIPVIALENKTVFETAKTSFTLMIKAIARVCTGSLWLILFLIIVRAILAFTFSAESWPFFVGTLIISAIFGTVLDIFRTNLYSLYRKQEDNHNQCYTDQF